MIYLQKSPTPAAVLSLWCVLSMAAGGAILLFHALAFPSRWFLWIGLGSVAAVFAVLRFRLDVATPGYAWMVRFQSGVVLAAVRRGLMAIAFFGIIRAASDRRSKPDTTPPPTGETLWKSTESTPAGSADVGSQGVFEESSRSFWLVRMFRWVRETRCPWLAGLIPLMAIMAALEADRRRTRMPSETYTLY